MPQSGTIYRILTASPSDCIEERKVVPEVISAWNAAHSLHAGAILEPVLWETHARPELGDRPQAIINKQLVEHCDVLIGTFWTRLGTDTGKAESGTAEEIEEFRAKGKPVLLYFSSAPVVPQNLDREQFDALMKYKKKLQGTGIYFEYDSISHFRQLLQGHLAGTLAGLHVKSIETPVKEPEKEAGRTLIDFRNQLEQFARRVNLEWSSERDSDPIGTADGKRILEAMLEQLLNYRSQIITGIPNVAYLLEEIMRETRKLLRHHLVSGGESFQQFWRDGNSIMMKLSMAPTWIPDAG